MMCKVSLYIPYVVFFPSQYLFPVYSSLVAFNTVPVLWNSDTQETYFEDDWFEDEQEMRVNLWQHNSNQVRQFLDIRL